MRAIPTVLVVVVLLIAGSVGFGARTGGPAGARAASAATRLAPTVGDWEGVVDGFPASFAIARAPAYPGDLPFGYRDLVLLEPSTCPYSPSQAGESQVGFGGGVFPLRADGSFGLGGRGVHGGVTGARTAALWVREFFPPAEKKCDRRLTWRFHPAHRLPVTDGSWVMRLSNGTSQSFQVNAGGRYASGIAYSSCVGAGDLGLFIPADGKARFDDGTEQLWLSFYKGRAAGTLSFPGANRTPSCPASMTISASVRKRAP